MEEERRSAENRSTAEEIAAKNAVYDRAVEKMKEGSAEACTEAVSLFSQIPGWRDSDLRATRCFERISRIRAQQRERRNRQRRTFLLVLGGVLILALALTAVLPGILYNRAVSRMNAGDYAEAEELFRNLGTYSDSAEKAASCETEQKEEARGAAQEPENTGTPGETRGFSETQEAGEDAAAQTGAFREEDQQGADASPEVGIPKPAGAAVRSSGTSGNGTELPEEAQGSAGQPEKQPAGAAVRSSGTSGNGTELPEEAQGSAGQPGKQPAGAEAEAGNGGRKADGNRPEAAAETSAAQGTQREEPSPAEPEAAGTGIQPENDISAGELTEDNGPEDGTAGEKDPEKTDTEKENTEKNETEEEDAERNGGRSYLPQILTVCMLLALAAVALFLPRLLRPALRYRKACGLLKQKQEEAALPVFRALGSYRDSPEKAELCEKNLKDRQYAAAAALQEAERYEEAAGAFEALAGWRDSVKRAQACRTAVLDQVYDRARQLKDEGRFEEAAADFAGLGKHRDSTYQWKLCRQALEKEPGYRKALALYREGKEDDALALFRELREFRDAKDYVRRIMDARYEAAAEKMRSGDLTGAIAAFSALTGYRDSMEKIRECRNGLLELDYQEALALKAAGRYEEAIDLFRKLRGYRDSRLQAGACRRAVRTPRPFDRLYRGEPEEEILTVFGKPESTAETEKGTVFSYAGVRFLEAAGSLMLEFERGLLSCVRWRADFSWRPGEYENAGKYPVIEYGRCREYYTSLFGECASDYLQDGHKGCWWREPRLTLDVNDHDFVTILCEL